MPLDYETIVSVEAAWTALALFLAGVVMLRRPKEDLRDWGVIAFVFSASLIYTLIAIRWLFVLPLWVGVLALGMKALASTGLFVWVLLASRSRG